MVLVIVFFCALGLQLIYILAFLASLLKKRPVPRQSDDPVSVIVCAHDEEQNLRELVPLLLDQQYAQFEVIIVNDRSNDNTYDFLREETARNPRLKMVNVKSVPDHVNNKKYALTLGIRAATFDWILLTDADCRPKSKNWISRMSEQFDKGIQFVLGFSPYEEKPGFLNHFIRFESLVTALQYFSFAQMKNPYMGVGRNLVYRKSLFLEKKGFNNFLHLMGGDDDLFVNQHARGAATRVQYHPESVVYSIPETTWKSFFYQKVRHLSVGRHYRPGHKILLGIFQLTWMLTWLVGLPLAFLYSYYYIIIGVLIIRLVLFIVCIRALTQRAGIPFNFWIFPFLDFVYPIYYISTGLVALLTKKVRWKN